MRLHQWVSSDGKKIWYQLPLQTNQGKAPVWYSDYNPKEVEYPIAHYVSCGHLPVSIQGSVNHMSPVIIPTRF